MSIRIMRTAWFGLLLFVLTGLGIAETNKLYRERIYEPMVMKQSLLQEFYGVPVEEMYLYAWSDSTQSWRLMPFQVDERIIMANPYDPAKSRFFYACSDQALDDGLFDEDDELVFMIRDMGDQAPPKAWIDNAEAKSFNKRLEIRVYDPRSYEKSAFAYLFRSSTITESVPTPYQFTYYPDADSLCSKYYNVAIDKNFGILRSIQLNPPFGTGVDIFDRQKILLNGYGDFGVVGIPFVNTNEMYLKVYSDYKGYTKNPVVRMVREVRMTIRLGYTRLEDAMAFFVAVKFYPFSGTLEGGEALDPNSLAEAFPEAEVYLELYNLRQSWDLSPAAAGMRFFSKRNNGLVVDGVADVPDPVIEKPINEWMLTAGDQGAIFSMTTFPDTVADAIQLYFYDNSSGGMGDAHIFKGAKDTGDGKSYGDQGFLMSVPKSLKLGFLMYFLPGTFNTREQAQQLADYIEHRALPVTFLTGVEQVEEVIASHFQMLQNYPNPFNAGTRLTFQLSRPQHVVCTIYDVAGHRIATLADQRFGSGGHELSWDGRDQDGRSLPSGVFFAVLQGASFRAERKLLLLR